MQLFANVEMCVFGSKKDENMSNPRLAPIVRFAKRALLCATPRGVTRFLCFKTYTGLVLSDVCLLGMTPSTERCGESSSWRGTKTRLSDLSLFQKKYCAESSVICGRLRNKAATHDQRGASSPCPRRQGSAPRHFRRRFRRRCRCRFRRLSEQKAAAASAAACSVDGVAAARAVALGSAVGE